MRGFGNKLIKASMLALQLIAAAVICEVMYRGYLKWFTEPPEKPIALPDRVHVYWPAPFTYRPYGYDYGPPSGRVVQLELKRDAEQRSGYRVNHVNEGAYAEFGNLPPAYSDHRQGGAYNDVEYDRADLKILVFGDSFAGAWPDLLQYRLEQKTGLRVRVLNFARDGIGVMQMIDAAAHHVPQFKPDIFLVAVTTTSVVTPRTWRGVTRRGNYDRLFMSTEEDENPRTEVNRALGNSALVNPIVEQIFHQYSATKLLPSGGDPRVVRLADQIRAFAERTTTPRREVRLLDLTRSFIFNRVHHGDARAGTGWADPELGLFESIYIDDFRSDRRMVAAIEFFRKVGARYSLVHTPAMDIESRDRNVLITPNIPGLAQHSALLTSLGMMTGRDVFSVASKLPRRESYAEFMVRTADPHPNKLGTMLYAEIIADHLVDRFDLPRATDPPANAWLDDIIPAGTKEAQ